MNAPRFDRPDHACAIKARLVDVRRVCTELGLLDGYKPEKNGNGLVVRCPAHGDRTPSCSVRVAGDGTIAVRCFGCDLAGDVFSLVAAARGLDEKRDFRRVLEEAADLAAYDLGDGGARAPLPPRPAPPPEAPPLLDATTFAAMAAALLELCPLRGGSVAGGLVFRGLLHEARRDGWGELPVDEGVRQVVAELRGRFGSPVTSWLLEGDRFRHPEWRLVIPWRDRGGRVNEVQRRYVPVLGDEDHAVKYRAAPKEVHRPASRAAYGVDDELLGEPDVAVWIVEGAADVLALRALNRNAEKKRRMVALGIPGVERWKQYRDSVLEHVKGAVVRVALDADRAGEGKVDEIVTDVYGAGASDVTRPRPPNGAKDWAEVSASVLWKDETKDARLRRLEREEADV